MVKAIFFEERRRILDIYSGSILLNVRVEDEYVIEHAAGALLLPLEEIDGINVLNSEKAVLFLK